MARSLSLASLEGWRVVETSDADGGILVKPDRLMEQVTGILVRAQVPYEFHEDGSEIGIAVGKTVIFMRPRNSGGIRLLHLEADLAVDIEMTQEVASGIYAWLNQRNLEEPTARFLLHEAPRQEGDIQRTWVSAEWELRADRLHATELLDSIQLLGARATSLGPALVQVFGGTTPERLRRELADPNGDEPTE